MLEGLRERLRHLMNEQPIIEESQDRAELERVRAAVIETQDRLEENRILGVALDDITEGEGLVAVDVRGANQIPGRARLTPVFSAARGYIGSMYASYAMIGSVAYMGQDQFGAHDRYRAGAQYQYTERFPPEVTARAWKLLESVMKPDQYFAFMEGANIELENRAGDFRLIINKAGKFIILEGARGSGIVAQEGRIKSQKYPLGDEISAFIDWFNHRTKELIAQWGCGVYGIVREEGR